MLDGFEILTTSGVVLWSKSYAPVSSSIINGFVKDVFIEEKVLPGPSVEDDISATHNPSYKRDQYTLKWTSVKDLGLIFVAVYQSLLHLSWIDKLLDNIRIIFVDLYQDQLKKPHTSMVECEFDGYFDQQVKELESATKKNPQLVGQNALEELIPLSSSENGHEEPPPPLPGLAPGKVESEPRWEDERLIANSGAGYLKKPQINGDSTNVPPTPTPDTSRPSTPAAHIIAGKYGSKLGSRRARKAGTNPTTASSGDEKREKTKKVTGKKMRRWDADGLVDEEDGTVLDYSAHSLEENGAAKSEHLIGVDPIDPQSFGTRTGKGQFILKDFDSEVHSILHGATEKKAQSTSPKSGFVGSNLSAISGLFRNVIGGKVLTKEDLAKPMRGMEEHLLNKNVAREAVVRLCEGVEKELIGVKTASFESVETTIRSAMESSLFKILTPTTSLDMLRSIQSVARPSPSNPQSPKPRPYVISIVGVNGVGKSTNLSKLAFFLLHNEFNLLIAACDTFRSGAVEQLRVHARNLKELAERANRGKVELYEKGYGKDAANIAKDAVAYAAQGHFDVVLIDTAGRRHNDTRLMSNLEKFGNLANPDKIFMVGEALVGSDSVGQARSFNAAFGSKRKLDGFIISKCDTVGDMVGTLVSMVHATGIPVAFLGVGQHYGDLCNLSVTWAVRLLMS